MVKASFWQSVSGVLPPLSPSARLPLSFFGDGDLSFVQQHQQLSTYTATASGALLLLLFLLESLLFGFDFCLHFFLNILHPGIHLMVSEAGCCKHAATYAIIRPTRRDAPSLMLPLLLFLSLLLLPLARREIDKEVFEPAGPEVVSRRIFWRA